LKLFGRKSNDARIIVQKLFLQHKHVTQLKAREMVQRKTVMGGGGLGKLSDCSEHLQNVKYILSRDSAGGTAKQGRDQFFKQFCHYVVRF
jgi:DNA gyrase subunit B